MNASAFPVPSETPRAGNGAKAWMIVTHGLFLLSLWPWLIAAVFSLLMLTNGAPTEDPGLLAALIVVDGYPVYTIPIALWSWKAWRRGETDKALLLGTVLIIPAFLAFLCLSLFT